jgi:hypothetical protein
MAAAKAGDYDVDQIITASQDKFGHSANVRTHIPRPWVGMINEIVQSDDWPEYKGQNAFIRDAIYHRLHWASEQSDRYMKPEVAKQIIIAQRMASYEQLRQDLEQIEELMTDLDDTFRKVVSSGDLATAKTMLSDFEDMAHSEFRSPHLEKLLDKASVLRRSFNL